MRTYSRLVSLLCAVAMMCAIVPISAQPASAAPAVNVTIAVAAPLSAGSTTLGRNMQYGAELAVSEYTAQLTSAGVAVTVSPQDDRGNRTAAVDVANAIVADPLVMGVVGHLDSACSVPASKIYGTADLAMVTPMSSSPGLTQEGLNNVFRTCGTDTGQGILGANVAVKNLRLKRAYIVDDSGQYGRYDLADSFGKRFIANGGKVVGRAHTWSTQVDFRKLSASIKKKNPSVVYYGGSAKAGANLLRRLRRIGVKCQYIGGSGLYNSTFLSTAARPYSEGALATAVGLPNDQLTSGPAYESRFTSAYPGVAPIDGDDAYAYDATLAIIKGILGAVHDAGNNPNTLLSAGARDRVRAKVATADFYGVTGRVRFGSTGDRVSPQFSAWRVNSGAWLETAIIGTPGVSKSYETRHVDVLGSLSPKLPAGTHTVWLRFYRKNAKGQYVRVKTAAAGVVDSSSGSTYQAFNVKLGSGSYFAFARHSGNGLASMDSPSRYFTVQ
jgi:branched-chain amino acid transport system substrate-binding protein